MISPPWLFQLTSFNSVAVRVCFLLRKKALKLAGLIVFFMCAVLGAVMKFSLTSINSVASAPVFALQKTLMLAVFVAETNDAPSLAL